MKKLIVADSICWSRRIYNQHLTDKPLFTDGNIPVITPVHPVFQGLRAIYSRPVGRRRRVNRPSSSSVSPVRSAQTGIPPTQPGVDSCTARKGIAALVDTEGAGPSGLSSSVPVPSSS